MLIDRYSLKYFFGKGLDSQLQGFPWNLAHGYLNVLTCWSTWGRSKVRRAASCTYKLIPMRKKQGQLSSQLYLPDESHEEGARSAEQPAVLTSGSPWGESKVGWAASCTYQLIPMRREQGRLSSQSTPRLCGTASAGFKHKNTNINHCWKLNLKTKQEK